MTIGASVNKDSHLAVFSYASFVEGSHRLKQRISESCVDAVKLASQSAKNIFELRPLPNKGPLYERLFQLPDSLPPHGVGRSAKWLGLTTVVAAPMAGVLLGLPAGAAALTVFGVPVVAAAQGIVGVQGTIFGAPLAIGSLLAIFRNLATVAYPSLPIFQQEQGKKVDKGYKLFEEGSLALTSSNIGLALAPLIRTLFMPGFIPVACGAVALASACYLSSRMVREKSMESGVLPIYCAIAYASGVSLSALTWSFFAGAPAAEALHVALNIAAFGSVLGALAGVGGKPISMLRGAFAEPHVVHGLEKTTSTQKFTAAPRFVDPPQSAKSFVQECRDKQRLDNFGKPYWLGRPIVNVVGKSGDGLTTLTEWMAQELDADLVWTNAAQLQRFNFPGYIANSGQYFTALLHETENLARRKQRTHVLVIENASDLLPHSREVKNVKDIQALSNLLMINNELMSTAAFTHRTVCLLVSDNYDGLDGRLGILSNHSVIEVGSPSAAIREEIARRALRKLSRDPLYRTALLDKIDEREDAQQIVARFASSELTGRHIENLIFSGRTGLLSKHLPPQEAVLQAIEENTARALEYLHDRQVKKSQSLVFSHESRDPVTDLDSVIKGTLNMSVSHTTDIARELSTQNAQRLTSPSAYVQSKILSEFAQQASMYAVQKRIMGEESQLAFHLAMSYGALFRAEDRWGNSAEVPKEIEVTLGNQRASLDEIADAFSRLSRSLKTTQVQTILQKYTFAETTLPFLANILFLMSMSVHAPESDVAKVSLKYSEGTVARLQGKKDTYPFFDINRFAW